uniref:indole-3-pyruvate monooxygenase n=1 Tax=Solanum lycopersicum TaxID=4081 RepID=A0A3Q7EWS0_SOLLC
MTNFRKKEIDIVVVGAGPSGIAFPDCVNNLGINNKNKIIVVICGRKRQLYLHLSKDFFSWTYMSQKTSSPKYIPKKEFIQYLDEHVERFNIKQKFKMC